MKFIHITDTHINAPGKTAQFPVSHHVEKVEQVFKHIQDTNVKPAFALITGDISHGGDVEDYQFIRALFDKGAAQLGIPFYVVLGNHDHLPAFREGYLGQEPSDEKYYYAEEIAGLRVIGLNSQIADKPGGIIDDVQLAWLKKQLEQPAPKGTVIALHHPLIHLGDLSLPGMLVENRQQVMQVIHETDVVATFSGHIHTNYFANYQNVLHIAGAGTSFTVDFSESKGNVSFVDLCGYSIVTVHENDGVTAQYIELPRPRGEYMTLPLASLTDGHKK
ncbi:metallophosphoesterase family protein [Paenibacillus sp. GCM10012307]|uniref:Metallophosphoesterase n=1 Tax=Paenibacillus roseus TaxID=2798579 RepID=A0A934J487_9BACL|nr:metallophosphoesterase [Paenibacillus roseus]MBJ6360037.1 metallophosphoesterase [Paenibacillus roseus]